jgi:S1-C subfamily serine protease
MMKRMMAMMGAANNTKKQILAPAGQWGFKVAKGADDKEAGVDVTEVLENSPAARAGMKSNDRLLTLDGRWTDSVADCYDAASHVRPGQEARLIVLRDGKEVSLLVQVEAGI